MNNPQQMNSWPTPAIFATDGAGVVTDDDRITESGDTRITESGDTRITE